MPYKSDAQRRLFHAKLARGEISKKVVDEFDEASKGMNLPSRLHPMQGDSKHMMKHGYTIEHKMRGK